MTIRVAKTCVNCEHMERVGNVNDSPFDRRYDCVCTKNARVTVAENMVCDYHTKKEPKNG